MFHGRKVNNRINHIHERSLSIIYSDQTSTFDELLVKDGSCSIHHRNIQSFAIELFKISKNFSNQIINEIFNFWDIT